MKKCVIVITVLLAVTLVAMPAFADRDPEFNKALRYYGSKQYKSAIAAFDDYLATKPDPAAFYLRGYSYYKLGNFQEAERSFREAYMIDPEFSLEKYGLITEEAAKAAAQAAPAEAKPAEKPAAPPSPPAPAAPAPAKPAAPPAAPAPAPTQQAAPPAPQPVPAPVPSPPPAPQPTPAFPKARPAMPPEAMPGMGALVGIFAGMMMVVLAFAVVLYLFFAFCLYKIATKLNVPAAWTAFIPLAQLWAFVGSAGKPWWWIFLLFIPFVGALIGIYLWMCISENLGRSKWLGLLILVPIVNLVFIGILAFSRK